MGEARTKGKRSVMRRLRMARLLCSAGSCGRLISGFVGKCGGCLASSRCSRFPVTSLSPHGAQRRAAPPVGSALRLPVTELILQGFDCKPELAAPCRYFSRNQEKQRKEQTTAKAAARRHLWNVLGSRFSCDAAGITASEETSAPQSLESVTFSINSHFKLRL